MQTEQGRIVTYRNDWGRTFGLREIGHRKSWHRWQTPDGRKFRFVKDAVAYLDGLQLKRAHEENPIFAEAPELTLRTAWRTLRLTLWDEANKRMIGFREHRQMQRLAAHRAA